MRAYLLGIAFAILCGALVFAGLQSVSHSSEPPRTGPAIYITRTDRIRTMDGRDIWILEHTIDGIWQSPAFNSREAMIEYREYLDTIGKVYQREED